MVFISQIGVFFIVMPRKVVASRWAGSWLPDGPWILNSIISGRAYLAPQYDRACSRNALL